MVGEGQRQHEGGHREPELRKRCKVGRLEHESKMNVEAVFKDKMSDDFCEK